jgi:hypothetical protein
VTLNGLDPAAATRADSDFARAMAVPEALLKLRDELPPKQWVSRDLALNRSVVVLTVAAWQAWVETYVSTALAAMNEPPSNRSDDTEYLRLLSATGPLIELATREVGRFSTPDASEVCRLLRLLGDDPRPRWSVLGANGPRSPDTVIGRLNGWVKVRHAIAHLATSRPSTSSGARREGTARSRIGTPPSARRSSESSPLPPAIRTDAAAMRAHASRQARARIHGCRALDRAAVMVRSG